MAILQVSPGRQPGIVHRAETPLCVRALRHSSREQCNAAIWRRPMFEHHCYVRWECPQEIFHYWRLLPARGAFKVDEIENHHRYIRGPVQTPYQQSQPDRLRSSSLGRCRARTLTRANFADSPGPLPRRPVFLTHRPTA